jgi:hypothetical protein
MGEEEVIAMDEFNKFEQRLARKEMTKDPKSADAVLQPFVTH